MPPSLGVRGTGPPRISQRDCGTERRAAAQAMVPYNAEFLQDGQAAVEQGYVAEGRIDIAVDRVLALKHRVGLLDSAKQQAACNGEGDEAQEASARREEMEQSAAAAAAGVVLLKNEGGALPLDGLQGGGGTVAVVGPSAQSAVCLLGGWSVHWNGPDSEDEVRSCPPTSPLRIMPCTYQLGGVLFESCPRRVAKPAARPCRCHIGQWHRRWRTMASPSPPPPA